MENGNGKLKSEMIERIVKLIALANDPGATENEKAVAADRAAVLMAKYHLNPDDIKAKDGRDQVSRLDIPVSDPSGKDYTPWEGNLIVGISKAFDCEVLRTTTFPNRKNFVVFGYPKDMDMVNHFFHFILRTVHAKGDIRYPKAGWRDKKWDFCLGMVTEISSRLREAYQYRNKYAAEAGTMDLIVVKEKAVSTARVRDFPKLNKGRSQNVNNVHDYLAGKEEGKKVNLSRPLASHGEKKGELPK